MQNAIDATTPTPVPPARPYVRHAKRDMWGRALFLWEREGKRGYQFEDGDVRVFAEGYYHFLQPAVAIDAELRVRLEQLALKNGALPKADDKSGKSKGPAAAQPTLADQLTLFLEMFPEGFAGEAFATKHRGGKGRRVKRHRDPALAVAADLLRPDALRDLVDRGMYAELATRLVDVLAPTDLVTKAQLDALRKLTFDARLAAAMVDFIHGDGDEGTRFRTLRRALARAGLKTPAWPMLTGLLALAHPERHVCVRRSAFERQAKLLSVPGKRTRKVCVEAYQSYRAMAEAIRDELTERGRAPKDMFDLHDFIWLTLRPAAKADLETAMVARMSAEAAEAEKALAETAADPEAANDDGDSDDTPEAA